MPCTLEPWEIEWEERRENKEKFNRSITDASLLEEVACAACRVLFSKGIMKDAPPIVQKWARLHRIKDRGEGR